MAIQPFGDISKTYPNNRQTLLEDAHTNIIIYKDCKSNQGESSFYA